MSTIEPWLRALDRATIEIIQKLGQAMNDKPTRAELIGGRALGICCFWLRALDIPELDAAARGELEQALVVRLARRFSLGMELTPWQDRAAVDARVEQNFVEVSRATVDRVALILESAKTEDNRFYEFGMLFTMEMVDWEKLKKQPGLTFDEIADDALRSREVVMVVLAGASIVSAAVESARQHT